MTLQQFLNDPIISDELWQLWTKSPCSSKYQLRPDGKGALFQHFQASAYELYIADYALLNYPAEIFYTGFNVKAVWDATSFLNNEAISQKELNEQFFNIVNNHKELDNEPGYFNQLNLINI